MLKFLILDQIIYNQVLRQRLAGMNNNQRQQWKTLARIGQGEHGVVYLVESSQPGSTQYAALKKVTYSSKLLNDFEFSALPQLSHPNIIKIMQCNEVEEGSEGEHFFQLLLEYAQQGDLSSYARKKYGTTPIPQDRIVKWLCQICLGLHYLHNQVRVLHRDIKAKNVLIMANGMLKIADFGTARQLKKHQQFAMTSVGTPCYLSPEAVKGPKYNSKSDIWGLGCIMFELCAGRKPFQGNNLNDLIKQILSSEIEEIPEFYSDWFRQLIKSMLEKSPEKRPSIESIFEKAEVRQAFLELKLQYQAQYKDLSYPVAINDLKTKKYCEREQKSRVNFCSESLKTVKNQKNIKIQILEWKNDVKSRPKKESKVADLSKFKNRSLKSIIEKRKTQKKQFDDQQKPAETQKSEQA